MVYRVERVPADENPADRQQGRNHRRAAAHRQQGRPQAGVPRLKVNKASNWQIVAQIKLTYVTESIYTDKIILGLCTSLDVTFLNSDRELTCIAEPEHFTKL